MFSREGSATTRARSVRCPPLAAKQDSTTIMSEPLLEAQGISKAFPGVQALQDVSLRLGRGEVLAVIGENGAGKSTLMKILGGVYAPDAGAILLDGKPVTIPD